MYLQHPVYDVLSIDLKAATLQIPAGIWNMTFCWCWQPNEPAFAVNQPLYHSANEEHPWLSVYALSTTDHTASFSVCISDPRLSQTHTHTLKPTDANIFNLSLRRGTAYQHKQRLLCMTVTSKIIKQIRKFFKCSPVLESQVLRFYFTFCYLFFSHQEHFICLCNTDQGVCKGQQLQDA